MSKLSDKMNKRVAALTPAAILTFNQKISAIPDIVKLTLGEPDFNTPEHVKQAAIKAIDDNESHYTNSRGTEGLRQAAANFLNTKYGLNYDPDKQVIMTEGATGAIYSALTAMINPGDTVIVPTPIFPLYVPILMLAGAKPIFVDTSDNGFVLSPEKLSAAIEANKDTVKAVILNFPNNPTGVTYHKDDLQKLADVISKHDIICLSDEIYCELIYDGRKHVSIAEFPGMKDYTIVFNGFSKSFAMTGWRIGYMCAPHELLVQCCKLHAYTAICPPIFSQYAATEGLKNAWSEVERMRVSYQQRRNLMYKAFNDMGLPCTEPEGAFYMFPDIRPTGMTSAEFATELIQKHNVAVVPGTCFGDCGEGFIRCCYATDINKIKVAMERISDLVKEKIK